MSKPTPTVPEPPSPEPSPFLEAFRVLSHITTAISILLLLGGLGYVVDRWAGVTFFSLLGAGLGGFLGIRHLIAQTPD